MAKGFPILLGQLEKSESDERINKKLLSDSKEDSPILMLFDPVSAVKKVIPGSISPGITLYEFLSISIPAKGV